MAPRAEQRCEKDPVAAETGTRAEGGPGQSEDTWLEELHTEAAPGDETRKKQARRESEVPTNGYE